MSQDSRQVGALVTDYLKGGISRRQFFQRGLALGLSLTAVGTLLAACTTRQETSNAPGTGSSATQQGSGTQQEGASGGGKPRVGGTLREGFKMDFHRMDPINTVWYDPAFAAVYETLLTADPDGQFVPMLAEKWEVSPDGTTWTFKIRDGVKFHSGAPCDAAAVAAAMNVMRDPNSGNPNLGFWSPVQDISSGAGNTLVVKLAHPYADLAAALNNGYAAIPNVARRNELGAEFGAKELDGTGPFMMTEFVPGSHVLVTRNENYAGSTVPFFSNKGKSYLDEIRWVTLQELGTRAQEIESGNIDALNGPAPQDIERLKGNPDLAVLEFPMPGAFFIGLNFEKKQLGFDDVRVRQAVSYAINRQVLIDRVFFGSGVPVHSLIAKGNLFYNPEVEKFNGFDPNQARSLLDQAGWTLGGDGVRVRNGKRLSFNLVIETGAENKLIGETVQAMLKDVGVEMNLQILETGTFYETLNQNPEAYLNFYLWPNPFDVSILFASSSTRPAPNWQLASISELDAAFSQWQQAANVDEMTAAANKAQLIAAEQLPFVPIATPLNVWVHRKKVHGWIPTQFNLYPYYNDVWIEA